MPAEPQLRRLFFALWPPEALRDRLERNTRTLARESGGRVIPARNFHVTVLFVGAVPQPQLPAVMAAATATPSPAFTLTLDRIEAWSGPGVLVLSGSQTPPALATLVTNLRFSLLSQQIKLKQEVYRPHITLVRNLSRVGPIAGIGLVDWPVEWPVNEYVLIDSTVTHGRSDYRVLGRWPLA